MLKRILETTKYLNRIVKDSKMEWKSDPKNELLKYKYINAKRDLLYRRYNLEIVKKNFRKLIKYESDYIEIEDIKFLNMNNNDEDIFIIEFIDIYVNDNNQNIIDTLKYKKVYGKLGEGPYTNDIVKIESGDIVVDVGANMGLFSIFAAKHGCEKIYSFEPQKRAIDVLEKNIKLNSFENKISIVPYGLSDKAQSFKMTGYSENIGGASIVMEREINDSTVVETINCVTLDKWVEENDIKKIDFIKADIEGSERDLLRGATNVMKNLEPKLAICTYHLPDDPQVLESIIKEANSKYVVEHTSHKLFAYVPKQIR